jgi:hypothetical protein
MPETSTKKQLSATVYYLLTGIIISLPCLVAVGVLLPKWQTGTSLTPLSLAVIHALILGTMLTVAFGVLYQIVSIAFQAPPLPRHVLYWHLPIHILSVAMMVYGFMMFRYSMVGIGGILLSCNSAVYFTMLLRSYLHARNKTMVHRGLVLPFASLWITMLIGLFQALAPSHTTAPVLISHLMIGGFAFWGGLVITFSYKLLPMFAISHGYKASLGRTAILYYSGAILLIISAWLPVSAQGFAEIGGILILFGLASFVIDVASIIRCRKRRRMVRPVYHALTAASGFVLGHVLTVISVLTRQNEWLYPAVFLFVFGGLLPLMFAYVQKMVPFLWFEYRFSKRPERKTAPLIDDMVPHRTAQAAMMLYFLGAIAGLAGLIMPPILSGIEWLANAIAWMSSICMATGTLILFIALRHVLTIGGPRPEVGEV